MKKYFLLLVMYTQVISSYSQDFWEQLPFPFEASIRCIATNDQGDIFVGAGNDGDHGGVYRSMDDGQTWEFVLDMLTHSVLSIEINDEGTIYAGTNRGFPALCVSYNNGVDWEELTLPSTQNVVKILCTSPDTLYVSQWEDYGAVLLRSNDTGITWETLYTSDHTSEYVSDISISGNGDIAISLSGFFFEMGGVYKSTDNGITWECAGLFNYQVRALEYNQNNDLFIGVWSGFYVIGGGLFALFNGESEIQELYYGPFVSDLVINSNSDIYFAIDGGGVIRTLDIGQTFEFVNQGLVGSGILTIDNQDYIYNASDYGQNKVNRTIEPTVTSVESYFSSAYNRIRIVQNPAIDKLRARITWSDNYFGTSNVSIQDIAGRTFFKKSVDVSDDLIEVDVNMLVSGMYILLVQIDSNYFSSKFIKL